MSLPSHKDLFKIISTILSHTNVKGIHTLHYRVHVVL